MMRKYIEAFMKEQAYPREAREELVSVYDKIMADDILCDLLCRAIDVYGNNSVFAFDEALALCEELEKSSLIHEYEVNLVFFICLTQHLKARYKNAEISTEIWFDTVSELKYKMIECKDINNIWGIADYDVFYGIFNLKRFTLGRLQFELERFGNILPELEYNNRGIVLMPDTSVINVCVPRMLKALDKELLDEAYAMAKKFFGKEPSVFVYAGWMLFPGYATAIKGLDIESFAEDFDLIATSADHEGEHPDMVKVFDMEYTGRAEDYPENTIIRKRFKDYLINGGKTGRGIGIKVL